jgi:tocopherol cyclase
VFKINNHYKMLDYKGDLMSKIWKPEVFQGRGKKKDYFEGWYFKSVSKDEKMAYAIIAGLSITKNPKNSHAFVMFVDARKKDLHYYQYPLSSFWANKEKFEIKIGNNFFSLNNIFLDMDDGQTKITAQMKFENIIPWPVKRFSPGVMGIYAFIPFMECYHGVLSFNHSISGYVEINGEKKDFTGGKGYIEKDWGSSMPSSWIWMHTNHFDEDGLSLFGSIAKIPWLGNYFTGYIFGLLYNKRLYKFTTYNGAKIKELQVTKDNIKIIIAHKNLELQIDAIRAEGEDIPAPKLGEMTATVNESLQSRINIKLFNKKKKESILLFSGTGRNAGLEFVGDLDELLKGF